VFFCKLSFEAVGLSPSTCESVSNATPTNLHGSLLMHLAFHRNWAYSCSLFCLPATVELPLSACICWTRCADKICWPQPLQLASSMSSVVALCADK